MNDSELRLTRKRYRENGKSCLFVKAVGSSSTHPSKLQEAVSFEMRRAGVESPRAEMVDVGWDNGNLRGIGVAHIKPRGLVERMLGMVVACSL